MDQETWRPLGVDEDDEIAEYDALHVGIPTWMEAAFWAWIRSEITRSRRSRYGNVYPHLDHELLESMGQILRIAIPNLRYMGEGSPDGAGHLDAAIMILKRDADGIQVADFLLAHRPLANGDELEKVLARSKSAYTVGRRAGRPGLIRRVPMGVQVGADSVMERAGRAGIRLARAWEALYGIQPNASEAYRNAIRAVEDVAVPLVSPKDPRATLGKMVQQMEDQGDWSLPMYQEDKRGTSKDTILKMMRLLWHGQHDRHGGVPTDPGDVNEQEAIVAVGIATTLVQWFDSGVIARRDEKTE